MKKYCTLQSQPGTSHISCLSILIFVAVAISVAVPGKAGNTIGHPADPRIGTNPELRVSTTGDSIDKGFFEGPMGTLIVIPPMDLTGADTARSGRYHHSFTHIGSAHALDRSLHGRAVEFPEHHASRDSMTAGIQEAVDALPPEGGTVFLDATTYVLKASVALRSDVALIGTGDTTILTPVDETVSNLTVDAAGGQNLVEVVDSGGFEVGMSVIVVDATHSGGDSDQRYITAIDGNTITLDKNLDLTFTVASDGKVVNAFPVIWSDGFYNGTTYINVLVQDLKVDGNKTNIAKYSYQQAGISFIRTADSIITNVTVENSSYEGILDLGGGYTGNEISNNQVVGSAHRGMHIGSINYYDVVTGNTIENSGTDGIYFCTKVQGAVISNNIIIGSDQHGIGGINPSQAGPDEFNVIEGNTITDSAQNGIYAWGVGHNSLFDNTISGSSADYPGVYAGIRLDTVDDFVVTGNIISANHGFGIQCNDSSTLDVSNNLIADNNETGIHCTATEITLTGNTLSQNSSSSNGGGIYFSDVTASLNDSILWGNTPDQIYLASGDAPVVSYNDVQGGYPGSGNIDDDPLFVNGPLGDFYLSDLASGHPQDSPCLDMGSDLADNLCHQTSAGLICMDRLSTSVDHGADQGLVNMGFHFDPQLTMGAGLTCIPSSGTVPFSTIMTVSLTNYYSEQTRRIAARIDADLAGGQHFGNWKSGFTNLAPGEDFTSAWAQSIPSLGSVIGDNVFHLQAEDVTPPPYNQPPYPPSGDTDIESCTVQAISP